MAALGAASAVGSHQAQGNAADQQRDVYARNKELADANALTQYAALQRREMEEGQAAAQALQENARRAAMARGSAVAAAGASGAAGGSVDAAITDITRQELGFTGTMAQNAKFRAAQFGAEREGVRSNLQSNILAALPTVAPPSFAGTLLRIGASGLNAYGNHLKYKPNTPGTPPPAAKTYNHYGTAF